METKNESNINSVRPDQLDNFANVTHQKGEIKMFTISEDKIDSLLSNSSSLNANFFFLVLGGLIGVITAFYSGGISEDKKPYFFAIMVVGSVLAIYLGIKTAGDEYRKRQLIKKIKNPVTVE